MTASNLPGRDSGHGALLLRCVPHTQEMCVCHIGLKTDAARRLRGLRHGSEEFARPGVCCRAIQSFKYFHRCSCVARQFRAEQQLKFVPALSNRVIPSDSRTGTLKWLLKR